jgi:PIN domain nuclease of toxin-antitoxin system
LKLLLDTHVLLWTLLDQRRLSSETRAAIQSEESEIFVSVVSPWEFAIKRSLGKFDTPVDLEPALEDQGFKLLPVQLRHTQGIRSMPNHHRDPFDRMLVAQATVDGLTLVTSDRTLRRYPVATLQAS